MKAWKNALARFIRDQRGAAAVEYALIAALIAAVIVIAVTTLGTRTGQTYTTMDNAWP
jgi:pilus assembly protein Flp/PilA